MGTEQLKGLAYGPDWENSKKRWEAFWNRDVYDRPVMLISSPRSKPVKELLDQAGYTPCFDMNPALEFTDFTQMLARTQDRVARIYTCGEAIPVFDHRWSVAQALAWGCEPAYNANAAWCHPLAVLPEPCYANENGAGWKWMLDTARRAAESAMGNFYVRPDWGNHTGDILATIMGNYEMLTAMADDPFHIKRLIREVSLSLDRLYGLMYGIAEDSGNEGTVNYIGCWSPGRSICLDCDISCMLSPEMFSDMFLEPIIQTMMQADHRMYHLDGPGAIKHLDTLLGIRELHGIQWVPGAGHEAIAQWLPILGRIQSAGKALLISIEPEELPFVLKELKPEGLCLSLWADSEATAQRLQEKAKL